MNCYSSKRRQIIFKFPLCNSYLHIFLAKYFLKFFVSNGEAEREREK